MHSSGTDLGLAWGFDGLCDGAVQRLPFAVAHLDPDLTAEPQKRRLRLAVADRLDRTQFGDARIAEPAVRDRPARTAISITIRDRARADDGAGGERPCHRGVRKQPAEIEGHVDACVWFAERLAIDERDRKSTRLNSSH